MKILKRYLSIILIIIGIMVIFSGCVEKKNDISTINQKNTYLMYDIGNLPEDLSKTDVDSSRVRDLERILFQGLIYDKEDNNGNSSVGYALAKNCDISKDGLVYTFTLKDNIKWSNGSDITAQDFVDFFKGILSQNYNSVYRYELKCIYGVSDFVSGNKDFSAVAITAPKDNVVQMRLNYPSPYFLELLAQPMYGLRKIDNNIANWKKDYENINYSGAFSIKKVESNGNILLSKNKNYVFKDSVKSNEIMLATNKNGSAYSLADFETYNNVDIFLNPPSTEIDRLKSKGEASIFPTLSVKGIFFNFKSNNVVSNYNFREGVSLAINRNELKNNIVGDYGEITSSYFPNAMNLLQVKNTNVNSNSQGEVSKYLNNSNYKKDNVIKFIYVDNESNKKTCENIVQMINDALSKNNANKNGEAVNNIKFDLKGYSSEDIDKVIKSNDYDMYLGEYNINYNSPMSFLEIWKSNSPYNEYGFKDLAYDDLMYNADVTKELSKKYEIYNKCIDELIKNVPVIPIYSKNTIVCSKDSIEGLKLNKFGNVLIENLQEK
ncbi:peptide ABC transporter substrate-binding protein [Clostridium pasteurianum]|uniref:ABC-type oligopeptide transport system, periplasmic component n=1 Tax=Clostridium pasteurianum BC1 TaxID=86416 RepID=R4K014_CLOPA|nr:peptide ABC transporter substrate-binding protein [Clostridium pasteurianum]AGK96427.1 ABC-type oligopeptide transport system, periplasmic component [Clostridium pasteurianum BC1]